jgi:uncharacterized membrane protein
LHGEADRLGGKLESLLLMPVIACGIYLLLLIIPRIDPGRENYANFINAYNAMRMAAMLLMAVTYGFLISVAVGYRPPVAVMVLLPMGLLFIVLGNYMGKLRPNWFAGARTPWTLSSKLSWNKTHQLAGPMMFAMGGAYIIAAFVPRPWMIGLAMAYSILSFAWRVVYSYLVYRRDPHRIAPAGTSPTSE